jgi:hypothetical protein
MLSIAEILSVSSRIDIYEELLVEIVGFDNAHHPL